MLRRTCVLIRGGTRGASSGAAKTLAPIGPTCPALKRMCWNRPPPCPSPKNRGRDREGASERKTREEAILACPGSGDNQPVHRRLCERPPTEPAGGRGGRACRTEHADDAGSRGSQCPRPARFRAAY